MKKFTKLSTGNIIARATEKTTLINTGLTPVYLIDEQSMIGLKDLEQADQQEVVRAYYALQPGQHKDLGAGNHHLDLGPTPSGRAVLLTVANAKPVTKKADAPAS